MSERPVLHEAIQALASVEAEHELSAFTEQRVHSTLRTRAVRARVTRQLLMGVVGTVFALGTAHAAYYGAERTLELLRSWTHAPVVTQARREKSKPVVPLVVDAAPQVAPPPAPAHSAEEPAPAAAPGPSQAEAPAPARRGKAVGAVHAPPLQLPAPPPSADQLYEEAHRLHFQLGDKHAALTAWERYLAAHPEGAFAPEAHYNRALCLVVLGRREQAVEALRPIAANERVGYRAADAKRLLRALEAAPSH